MCKTREIQARPWSAGFTMLELMIAVAILAILLGLAVPSFQDAIRSNQITSQTNSFITAIALARSEASKRRIAVSVCPRNGAVCGGTTNWSTGWLVFGDLDGDGDLDTASETTFQVSPPPTAGIALTSPAATFVTFLSTGGTNAQAVFTVTKTGCGTGQQREITVSLTGRTSVVKQNCP